MTKPTTKTTPDDALDELMQEVQNLTQQIDATSPDISPKACELNTEVYSAPDTKQNIQAYEKNLANTPEAEFDKSTNIISSARIEVADQRLIAAQKTIATTTIEELNLENIFLFQQQYINKIQQKNGIKLSLMSFFILAIVTALKKFPLITAQIKDQHLQYFDIYDINIGTPVRAGIALPVLLDAGNMSLVTIERQLGDIAVAAQIDSLPLKPVINGVFTIINNGSYGSMLTNPTLNPPQSASFGINKIRRRPIIKDNEIIIASVMLLALTYDFRIIDTQIAVQFLTTVKQLLENPSDLAID